MEQWRRDIKNSVTTFAELEKRISLSFSERKFFERGNFLQPFSLTPQILKLIDSGNPKCPIRLQFIPRENEYTCSKLEFCDPLNDRKWSPVSGIVHRFKNRCLLIPHMFCPAYCRFCFRKNVFTNFRFDEQKSFNYLKKHTEIEEVILSGGEPFLLPDDDIRSLLKKLNIIKHVKTVRFHTRLPVTLPSRFTKRLASLLATSPKQIVIVVHVNHPKEISDDFIQVIRKLQSARTMLLSQSVLLKEVNDDFKTLQSLFSTLVSFGVKPYYLHQLDRAKGTSHFEVDTKKGKELMSRLRREMSGISIPQYVVDTGDSRGKLPLF